MGKARRALHTRAGALLLLLLLTGCGPAASRANLVIINGPEPETLDPHLLTGQADGRIALGLFEGLTRYNPVDAQPEPGLADGWTISPDARSYTFHLRPGIRWSTGEPITARDFVWSWQRVLDPGTASEYAGALFYLKNGEAFGTGRLKDFSQVGVHAVDDQTLQVELEAPTAFFLDLLCYTPYTVVPRQQIEKYGDRWLLARPFMASGAYVLDQWRIDDRVRLRRNPNYWDAANTRSDTIDLLSCVSATTALNLFTRRAVDIVWDKELVSLDLLDLLRKRTDFHTFNTLSVYFYRCNVTRPPLNDPRVRQALALVIDKQRIVTRITRGGETIAECLSPPEIANGTNRYERPGGLGYDPARARQLLAEAGYPGGAGMRPLQYTYNTQENHRKIAVEMQEMWRRELGVQVELRQVEWKSWLQLQTALEYDLIRSSWVGDYNDPNTFLDLFMSDNPNNRTGWKSAKYDEALRAANAEADLARRQTLLARAETLIVKDEAAVTPLFYYVGMEFYDATNIQGLHSNLRSEHPLRALYRVPEKSR